MNWTSSLLAIVSDREVGCGNGEGVKRSKEKRREEKRREEKRREEKRREEKMASSCHGVMFAVWLG
jgi:hypothetical protein